MNTASLEFKVRELQTQLTQDFDLFGNGDPILADNYRYRDGRRMADQSKKGFCLFRTRPRRTVLRWEIV